VFSQEWSFHIIIACSKLGIVHFVDSLIYIMCAFRRLRQYQTITEIADFDCKWTQCSFTLTYILLLLIVWLELTN